MPLKNTPGIEPSSGSDTFILGPGYEAVGNGQVPQALPGEGLNGSPPISQSVPSISPFSTSAAPQSPIISSPSSPTSRPSMSRGSSAISVSSVFVLPTTSASSPVRLYLCL